MQGTLDGVTLTARYELDAPDGTKIKPGTDVTKVASGWRNLATYLNRGYIVANPPVDPYRLPVLPDPVKAAHSTHDEVTPVERTVVTKEDKPTAPLSDDAIAEAIKKLSAGAPNNSKRPAWRANK